MPLESVKKLLASLKPKHKRLLENGHNSRDLLLLSKEEQLKFFASENRLIAKELKLIDKLVSSLIRSHKFGKLIEIIIAVPMIKPVLKKSKLAEQELSNLKTQEQHMEQEYLQYKAVLEKISDPYYLIKLKEKALVSTLKLHELEKTNKKLQADQRWNDKEISRKREGEPELLQSIAVLKEDTLLVEQKLEEVEEQIKKRAEVLKEQKEKLKSAKEQCNKLSEEVIIQKTESNALTGINIYEKYENLVKKRGELMKPFVLIRTRCAAAMGDYRHKEIHLREQIARLTLALQEKKLYSHMLNHSIVVTKQEELYKLLKKSKSGLKKPTVTSGKKKLPIFVTRENLVQNNETPHM
eukprot:TRINITY_DN10816_c0_g4_i1.p1 TRINITY_DN10816_c0_g4~~TRINITY_DN10816_c0_g4_i1.p1  ORF type:complete len:353 (+),score=56.99 TRINITY_DN10816_c0_g4_i1:349-1407(+)